MSPSARRAALLLILLGVAARAALLTAVPAGVHQDEAFAAYEAYCLSADGMDSWGYRFPVYLTTWGSGMSVLLSLAAVPFVRVLGLNLLAVRLPMLILSCLTLPALYGCVRRLYGERTGLVSLFLLAISPWHVALSRWALDANLAPAFLVFGLYFFLRSLEDARFLPAAALLYGLTLYTYALTWLVVPATILLLLLYARHFKRPRNLSLRVCLFSFLLLFLLALPMLLFVAVNRGLLPEIRTPFLSVPRLQGQRMAEISVSGIGRKLHDAAYLFLHQSDGEVMSGTRAFGLYYPVSWLFFPFGLIACVRSALRREKGGFLLFPFLAALPLCALTAAMTHRINAIHIPILALSALGIDRTAEFLAQKTRLSRALPAFLAVYALLFAGFEAYYFTAYKDAVAIAFQAGIQEAVDRAKELSGGAPVRSDGVFFSRILFCDRTDPGAYRESVQWGRDGAFMTPKAFTRWRFGHAEEGEDLVCVTDIPTSYEDRYRGYAREEYGWAAVLIPPKKAAAESEEDAT